jgi:hypothetical protein
MQYRPLPKQYSSVGPQTAYDFDSCVLGSENCSASAITSCSVIRETLRMAITLPFNPLR